jgi:hypothetical protein
MGEHGGDEGFLSFRPPERKTLRPQENGSCIAVCCSCVGLALGCHGFSLSILTSAATFYSSSLQWLHCDLEPDRWPQVVGLPYRRGTLARSSQ